MHRRHVSDARDAGAPGPWDGRVGHLSAHAYARLAARAQVIEADLHGPKVLRTPGGLMCKLFRRKRLVSSALWRPYALRFARNSAGLVARGVPSVRVRRVWHCPAQARHVVAYDFLPGITLRERAACGALTGDDWHRLGVFLAQLHRGGVYFRSLHLGNVVARPQGDLGLIDVADMRLLRRPLRVRRRMRNLRHLLRDPAARGPAARAAWMGAYLQAAAPDLRLRPRARLARALAALPAHHGS